MNIRSDPYLCLAVRRRSRLIRIASRIGLPNFWGFHLRPDVQPKTGRKGYAGLGARSGEGLRLTLKDVCWAASLADALNGFRDRHLP
jgi:hypothetical protein